MTTIDVPTETTQAVATVERHESAGITPAQAKVEAVAKLTMSAYEKASELRLTKEETDALQAVFPDDAFQPGAAGKEHLIYIEHAHLRDRFNSVFGMGQWSIVPRNRWAEPFKTAQNKEGSRVYVEAMLVVRGCFVAEAVGAMEYYPHNAGQDYSDAVEGAKTAALRRCAKELGVGLQAWKKEFCEGWWQRRRAGKNGKPHDNSGASGGSGTNRKEAVRTERVTQSARGPAVAAGLGGNAAAGQPSTTGTVKSPKPLVQMTPELRLRFLNKINAAPGQDGEELFKCYLIAAGIILDTEGVSDLPFQYIPQDQRQMDLLRAAVEDFESGGDGQKAFVNDLGAGGDGESRPAQKSGPTAARGSTEPESKAAPENRSAAAPSNGKRDPEWFFDVVCTVPRKGMPRDNYMTNPDTIGSMYEARKSDDYLRKRLFGFMNNFVPQGWTKRDGTKMPPNKEDVLFREALDAYADWLQKKGDE